MTRRIVSLSLAVLLCSTIAFATIDRVDPAVMPDSYAAQSYSPPPLRLAEGLAAQPVMSLPPASVGAVDQLKALSVWNAAGRAPLRDGFARPLPETNQVHLDADVLDSADFSEYSGGYVAPSLQGDLVWGTVVSVEAAFRLRLHLTDVILPRGTRFWVYGLGEVPVEFGMELVGPEHDLWTPSVGGDWLLLEIEVPRSALAAGQDFGFSFPEVMELVRLTPSGTLAEAGSIGTALGECLLDATCVDDTTLDVIEPYRHAVAHLEFVVGSSSFQCTGGLLNDTDQSSFIPYLLTANHCFSTQTSASSLQAFWEYRTQTCFGAFPNLSGLPQSNGSTLLSTGLASDYTLIRLNGVPAGRALLGWNANQSAVASGTILHRISHPAPSGFPFPEVYTQTRVTTTFPQCNGRPRPQFIYSNLVIGGAYPGSSGAPVILAGGFVVGQLNGGCGPNPTDGCDAQNAHMDGAFASTFPSISQWLAPPPTGGPCVPSDTTLCIDDQPGDRRFEATMQFSNPSQSGFAHAIQLASVGVTRGGMFWIGNPANPEMLIKILNACIPVFGNKFWVFYAATTNQGLVTTVRDTTTGAIWSRTNPQGTPADPVQDTGAFNCS